MALRAFHVLISLRLYRDKEIENKKRGNHEMKSAPDWQQGKVLGLNLTAIPESAIETLESAKADSEQG